jgi:hypothetical protein
LKGKERSDMMKEIHLQRFDLASKGNVTKYYQNSIDQLKVPCQDLAISERNDFGFRNRVRRRYGIRKKRELVRNRTPTIDYIKARRFRKKKENLL